MAIVSCQKSLNEHLPQAPAIASAYKSAPVQLVKKLDNPFTVANMQKAYNNIRTQVRSVISSDESPVHTTHYYVRFLPKDWNEYDILKNDSTLYLYDYPLDYEVTPGNTYHDPSIPSDLPTWQYTSVPVGYQFHSSIMYEIIADLYLPEKDQSVRTIARSVNNAKAFAAMLEDEALRITGNAEDKTIARATNPGGVIRVFDTRLNRLIPLEGVHVRGRRWFDYRSRITDNEGRYASMGFARDCNYSLFFETSDFDIRSGTFGQASINGPKKSSWSLDIENGLDRFYAHTFRGAFTYWHGDNGGLKRPLRQPQKLKYGAFDKNKEPSTFPVPNPGIAPSIFIYRNNTAGTELASDEVYSATAHETAHWSHVTNTGTPGFTNAGVLIRESFAVGVEWFLTQREYQKRGIGNYGTPTYGESVSYPIQYAYQYWNINRNLRNYTPLFIDLVDDFNQLRITFPNVGNGTINDPVSGYNFPVLEFLLPNQVFGDAYAEFRNKLKVYKPDGVTDAQIDTLLNNF